MAVPIVWPKNAPLGHNNKPEVVAARQTKNGAQGKKASRRRDAGIKFAEHPGYNPDGTIRRGDQSYSAEALATMEDPEATDKELDEAIDSARVWERPTATPMIIDFTNVMEPIFPTLLHPLSAGSQHKDREMYQSVMGEVKHAYDSRALQMAALWNKIDQGKLPADFNPYNEGSVKWAAFKERVYLRDDRPRSTGVDGMSPGLLMTIRQTQRRAKRKLEKGKRLTDDEFNTIMQKPIEEWDILELANGHPRQKDGKFGPKGPSYMQAEVRERVDELFKKRVRESMNYQTVSAMKVIKNILGNTETDHRGRPLVAASTKLDAAKFLVEHVLGKPKQVIEEDISVKLQTILGSAMVSPVVSGQPGAVIQHDQFQLAQRGKRADFDDFTVNNLKMIEGYMDAEWVEDPEEES